MESLAKYPQAKRADIGLILEGSYPFVQGGVSQWVHQIIENFPQYTFAVFFLGGSPANIAGGLRYSLPKNVVHLQIDFLFPEENAPAAATIHSDDAGLEKIREMHAQFRQQNQPSNERARCPVNFSLDAINLVDYQQFLYSKQSWDFIVEQYQQYCQDPSFIDYFWTVRNIHQPLWRLANIVNHIPSVQVLHTISTGYAGLLGALLQERYHYPLVLSEHGIYTKERRIDIFQSQIVRDYSLAGRSFMDISYLRNLWNRFFETIGRICYQAADPIISLFHAAQQLQLEDGAPANKTRIIPNGVDIPRLAKLRRSRAEKKPLIGFVGRLAPIKDVKNFIRTLALVAKAMPEIQAWIIGPGDENPDYAQECRDLAVNLSLSEYIHFKPYQKLEDIFPTMSLVVLSSISEGMPLIVLESFAAGIPVVATDVGSCPELIEGADAEDQALGCAGKVVNIADPQNLSTAILELLRDPAQWQHASETAMKRVEKFYDQKTMIARYQDIYSSYLNKGG